MALTRLGGGDQHLLRTLPPLRLHLDDVQTVYEHLAELGDVMVSADMHLAMTPADLADLPHEVVSELYLRVPAREVAIHVQRGKNPRITAEYPTSDVRGVLGLVEQHLRSRRRRFVALILRPWFGIGLLLVAEVPFAVNWLATSDGVKGVSGAVMTSVGGSASVLLLARVLYFDGHRNMIVASRRRDAPGFWRRKKDDIWINVAFFVMGVAAGALLR